VVILFESLKSYKLTFVFIIKLSFWLD
jgi:hypothetical protein